MEINGRDSELQHSAIERYNRTVRYDWLPHYLFESISEVQEFSTK
jgi:putative transposase